MNENSYLNPTKIKEECDSAIHSAAGNENSK